LRPDLDQHAFGSPDFLARAQNVGIALKSSLKGLLQSEPSGRDRRGLLRRFSSGRRTEGQSQQTNCDRD
jgi:hypothetical protein